MLRTTDPVHRSRLRTGAAVALGLLGSVALAAAPAAAAPGPAPAVEEPELAVGLSIFVDDADPENPTGVTDDGAPSSAESLTTTPADEPVTLSIQLENEGTTDLDRASFADASGAEVWSDQWVYGDGSDRAMHPGDTTTFTQTLPAPVAGELLSGAYTVSAAHAGEFASAEAAYSLTAVPPEEATPSGPAFEMGVFANDADPANPTGSTADGAASAGSVTVRPGEDVDLTITLTTPDDSYLSSAKVLDGWGAEIAWQQWDDAGFSGAEPYALPLTIPAAAVGEGGTFTYTVEGTADSIGTSSVTGSVELVVAGAGAASPAPTTPAPAATSAPASTATPTTTTTAPASTTGSGRGDLAATGADLAEWGVPVGIVSAALLAAGAALLLVRRGRAGTD